MLRTLLITSIAFMAYFFTAPLQAQSNASDDAIDAVNFYFPPNAYKFKVSSEMKNYVEELKTFINENEGFKVKLDGFAQDGSNDAWNTRVSKYRVRAVRDLLLEYGIDSDKIQIEYFGKSNPISEGDSSRELAKNRRVELRILQEG